MGLWPELIAFFVASIVLCAGTYLLVRRFFASSVTEESHSLAKSMIDRIATLLALILALVFAQEFLSYNETRAAVDREGTLLSNIYFDLRRYDEVATQPIQDAVVAYAESAIKTEWPLLAREHRLDEGTWLHREQVYVAVLDLQPANGRQIALRDRMLRSVMQLGDERDKRSYAAGRGVSPAFWIVAFAGLVLVSIPFFVFPPTLANLVMIVAFGLYTGLVLCLIAAFADPFQPPGYIGPEPLHEFLAQVARGAR